MKASPETVKAIKVAKKLIPALNKNLGSANNEYMKGEIAHGAFNYVLSRHGNAILAINSVDTKTGLFDEKLREHISEEWINNLDENVGYCLSWMCHDLKSYVEIDLNGADKKSEKEKCETNIKKLEEHLTEMGFTEENPFFHIKQKPK